MRFTAVQHTVTRQEHAANIPLGQRLSHHVRLLMASHQYCGIPCGYRRFSQQNGTRQSRMNAFCTLPGGFPASLGQGIRRVVQPELQRCQTLASGRHALIIFFSGCLHRNKRDVLIKHKRCRMTFKQLVNTRHQTGVTAPVGTEGKNRG